MRNRFFVATAMLLASAGGAVAQPRPASPQPTPPGVPAALPDPDAAAFQAFLKDIAPPPEPTAAPPPLPAPMTTPLPVPPAPPDDEVFRPTQATSAYPFYVWGRSEFLLWKIKQGAAPPPLVTTGPSTAANPAVLTDPNTVVLFPTGPVDYNAFDGGRWAVGTWFDPCETWGAEVTGLLLVRRSTTFSAQSDAGGTPVLGIPFIDASTGLETVNYAAFPGLFAGGVGVTSAAQVWGMEGTFYADCGETTLQLDGRPFPLGDLRTHLLGGFRYLSLTETLGLTQPSLVLPGGAADFNGAPLMPGDLEVIQDAFNTRSQFFGGQIGVRSELDRGPFYAEFTGKVGLGDSHESMLASGATTLIPAATGVPVVAPGGFLATATNAGRLVRDQFAVVPECDVNVGWQPCPLLRFFVGYSFIYWSDVVRAADQIDRIVNLTAVPSSGTFGALTGPERPTLPFRTTDFWMQGVSFGFELRF